MSERLCVVMPVYNEREAIGAVLEKWAKALDSLDIDYVIRPYNDGSKDDSLAVMRKVAIHLPRVEVRDKANGGHGHTILTGYRDAAADGFDWVFQIDSDDEMGPEKFGELWAHRADYDFLVGIRDGRKQALPRKIISLVSRICVRLFYGKSVWDVNTPYRLMRVSRFKAFYAAIPERTFAPNVILSGLAARSRLRMYEQPVPQHDRMTGEVSIKKFKLIRGAILSFLQTMEIALNSRFGWLVFIGISVVSLWLRYRASLRGNNFDLESYYVVVDAIRSGSTAWETGRYNYGPIWFWVLDIMQDVFGSCFRFGIITFLSFCDVGIALILWKRKYYFGVFIFLLSYLSAHITGYHNQFDNFAVFVSLIAFSLIEKSDTKSFRPKLYWIGVVVLGVSIVIKHVFIFMPFWFLFRRGAWLRRFMSFALPLMIFALSFMPYVGKTLINDVRGVATIMQTYVVNKVQGNADDEEDNIEKQLERKRDEGEISANTVAIIENVFLYRSSRNKLMLFASEYIPLTGVFVCAMIIIGFVLRRWEWFDIWMTYLILFCAISPSMAMQYYAIPAAPVAILWCPFGLLYHMLLSVFYALPDKGYSVLKSWAYVMNMIVLLLCIRTLARKKVVL